MGSGGVAIAALPTVICLKVSFSDGLGGVIGYDRLLIDDYTRLKDYKIIAACGDERRMAA